MKEPNSCQQEPKVLIVGPNVYNRSSTTRAFETYFGNFKRENLAQIYTSEKQCAPLQCNELFHITDKMLLHNLLSKQKINGENQFFGPKHNEPSEKKTGSTLTSLLYKIGRKEKPLIQLLRSALWKENRWQNQTLISWIDSFKPDVVFLHLSNAFFILRIAKWVSERWGIPLICEISDDYYFNDHFSLSPFYHIYRAKYKKLCLSLINESSLLIFVSNDMQKKYSEIFHGEGTVINISSHIISSNPRLQIINKPIISYCGKVGVGRLKSLIDLGNALYGIDKNYYVDVYAVSPTKCQIKKIKKAKGLIIHDAVPYEKVVEILRKSDVNLVIETQNELTAKDVKYSLSTKIADCLSVGVPILAYGSEDAGAISFLKKANVAIVATRKEDLNASLRLIINSKEERKNLSEREISFASKNFDIRSNSAKCYAEICKIAGK